MKRLLRCTPRDWIGLTLILAGFVLRLRQYLVNRSLWVDEAMLVNNILQRDFAGLFRQLDNDQGAPIGFLLLQKAVILTLGDSEYALRLLPFLAGCLSLVLMFALTRKVSSAFAANLALALFAFSPALVYYSSEVKQYSSDAAITLGLMFLYVQMYTDDTENADSHGKIFVGSASSAKSVSKKNYLLLALTGALVIWFSHPALFVVGALGLALFSQAVREKDTRRIRSLLLAALLWSLNIAALYFVNLRVLASHQFFLDFWREGFLPRDASALRWLAFSLHGPFLDLLGLQIPYLVPALLFLLGIFGLTRRLPRFGLFLLLVIFLALLASFLTLYPFAGRMILFLVPILCLLLAEGVETAAGMFAPRGWLIWTIRLVLAGILLFAPISLTYENFTTPKMREHIRPAMQTLQEEWEEGDLIYVYYWAEPAVRYYAPKYGFAMSDFIIGADHHDRPELYLPELDALRGHARVWFLFSHVYEQDGFNEREYILSYLNTIGKLQSQAPLAGTSVFLYLYDLR